jgi:hypothetical protein
MKIQLISVSRMLAMMRDVKKQWSVSGYQLTVVSYQLPVVSRQSLFASRWLPVLSYS